MEEFGDVTKFDGISEEKLKEMVKLCSESFTSENFVYGFSRYPVFKPSFFILPDKICFVNFDGMNSVFYIELNDIEKFLKVEKW